MWKSRVFGRKTLQRTPGAWAFGETTGGPHEQLAHGLRGHAVAAAEVGELAQDGVPAGRAGVAEGQSAHVSESSSCGVP